MHTYIERQLYQRYPKSWNKLNTWKITYPITGEKVKSGFHKDIYNIRFFLEKWGNKKVNEKSLIKIKITNTKLETKRDTLSNGKKDINYYINTKIYRNNI